MPILAREPDLFPETLLDDDAETLASAGAWWAAYTLSRREKELVRRLRKLEIAHYCPMAPHRSRSPSGRVRTSWQPLFANYVFLHGAMECRHAALTTNCISRILPVTDPALLLADLKAIREVIDLGCPVTVESQLEVGTRVRFKAGPFHGREATIVQRRGKTRLLVTIEFLQQGVSVEAEDFEFEAVN